MQNKRKDQCLFAAMDACNSKKQLQNRRNRFILCVEVLSAGKKCTRNGVSVTNKLLPKQDTKKAKLNRSVLPNKQLESLL